MGLSPFDLKTLITMKRRGCSFGGSVMEIGAQQLTNQFLESANLLETLRLEAGITTPYNAPVPLENRVFLDGGLEHLDSNAPRAATFWEWLGFRYACIDFTADAISLDLNYDDLPDEHRLAYQIVTNFGTTEHVANQLNAFKVIHDLTAIGGYMLHNVPLQGFMQHGLVNYNPKFFWMLARSNDYEILDEHLSRAQDHSIPDHIMDTLAQRSNVREQFSDFKMADCGISVALKKVNAREFIAPLDIATGTPAPSEKLRKRYWTVFP